MEEFALECSLQNIASCIGVKLYDFLLNLVNAPIKPLVAAFESLLSAQVEIRPFVYLWSIIVYVLSFFYIFMLMYAAVQFLSAGDDAQKRMQAKESLKNAVLVLAIVQSSFYIYSLLIDMNASLTQGMLYFLSDRFLLPIELSWQYFEMPFVFMYVCMLAISVILLIGRFFLVAVGVIMFPLGIFLYFVTPLKEYGKSMLYFFTSLIFVPFFLTAILIGAEKVITLPLFSEIKPLVLVAVLLITNLVLVYITIGALLKGFLSGINSVLREPGSALRTVKHFL